MTDKLAPAPGIDARTFQKPLAELTETIALKIQREAVKTMKPVYVATDIYVMLRQLLKTYELFFYIHSDERRSDPAWHIGYPAAMFPLVRNIDRLPLQHYDSVGEPHCEWTFFSCERVQANVGGYRRR